MVMKLYTNTFIPVDVQSNCSTNYASKRAEIVLMGGNTAIGKCRKALGLSHAHKDKFVLVLKQTYAQILTFALYTASSK
jgi:hypothetical protein